MPPRLTEIYTPGDAVEVFFEDESGGRWHSAHIVGLQHPGVWVRTEEGYHWFVTNRRRIRPRADGSGSLSSAEAS